MRASSACARRIGSSAADVAALKQRRRGRSHRRCARRGRSRRRRRCDSDRARALRVDGVEVKPAATGRVNHPCPGGRRVHGRPRRHRRDQQVDPAITIATLAEFAAVEAGQMVATVKIIPFAVKAALVDEVAATRGRAPGVCRKAVPADEGRHRADGAARCEGQRACQDGQDHRGAAGALGQRDHGRAAHRS